MPIAIALTGVIISLGGMISDTVTWPTYTTDKSALQTKDEALDVRVDHAKTDTAITMFQLQQLQAVSLQQFSDGWVDEFENTNGIAVATNWVYNASDDTIANSTAFALSFDGTGDYSDFGVGMGGATSVTVSMWALWKEDSQTAQSMLATMDGAPIGSIGLGYSAYWAANEMDFVLCDSLNPGAGVLSVTTALTNMVIDRWYFLTFVYANRGAVTSQVVWIDGDYGVTNLTLSETALHSKLYSASTGYWKLGGGNNASWDYQGYIDEMAIWQSELTYAEHTNMFANGSGRFGRTTSSPWNKTSLKGLWHFDENTGTALTDSSGGGRTGTNYNNTTWVAGKVVGSTAMTLISTNLYLGMQPSRLQLMCLATVLNGALNTDFNGYVSRNAGTNWDQVSLSDIGSFDGTYRAYSGVNTNLSGTGSNVMWRLTTTADVSVTLKGVSVLGD